jgi:hypothetical protein
VLVALRLDQRIENLALGVDGAPEVNHAPIDFQILRQDAKSHAVWTALAQTAAIIGPKWFTQRRTVSYETAIPLSASKSSTSRKLSVNLR